MRSLEQLDRWIAGKVKNWTGKVAGGAQSKELLEVRRDILEEIRDAIQPKGGGKSVFPCNEVSVRIAAPDEREREVCRAAFAGEDGLESDIRELLAEAGCRIPAGFHLTTEVVEDPELAWSNRPFRIAYATRKGGAEPRSAGGERPRAKLTVLQGEAEAREYQVAADRFYIGRMKEVVGDRDGLRRRNDLAFAETETSVSREHAYLRYDVEGGSFRVYDSNSQRGTLVFRGGRRLDVPRGAGGGVQLQSGDEIHLGNARILFEIG